MRALRRIPFFYLRYVRAGHAAALFRHGICEGKGKNPKTVRLFLLLLVAALLILSVVQGAAAGSADLTPAGSFDLNRCLGTWYEIARYDHHYERNLCEVRVRYVRTPRGRVAWYNEGINYRTGGRSNRRGRMREAGKPGRFKVSFFWFFYSECSVLAYDPGYEWVLVGSDSQKYLWILSRTPTLPGRTLNRILRLAESRGCRMDELLFVDQQELTASGSA